MEDAAPVLNKFPDEFPAESSTVTRHARHPTDTRIIAADGDVVLDVTFETSKETLKAARKALQPRSAPTDTLTPSLKPSVRVGYRVRLSVLQKQSRYFSNLLGNSRFAEAQSVACALDRLSLQGIKPCQADLAHLPLVAIHEDDELIKTAGREVVFEHLLAILHGRETMTKPVTMPYLTTMALLADRFDCAGPATRWLSGLRFRWPVLREQGPELSARSEESVRQRILVSWLLGQPMQLRTASRDLIMHGSRRWGISPDADEQSQSRDGAWWDLPDGLETELQSRRACILDTLASVPRHFIDRYTSHERQCELGYDSSASCDSYQLGQMIKFLTSRKLLSLLDFSPRSSDRVQDYGAWDIGHLIATLRQCPNYQIDKNHGHCGLRTRLLPILDYLQAMLSSNLVPISAAGWKKARDTVSWFPHHHGQHVQEAQVFRFTRSVAADQRLRLEGSMAADGMAQALFTAARWDWAPDV